MRNGLAKPINRYKDELLDINEYLLTVFVSNLASDRNGCLSKLFHTQAEFNDVILNGGGHEIHFGKMSRNEVWCPKLAFCENVRFFIYPAQ